MARALRETKASARARRISRALHERYSTCRGEPYLLGMIGPVMSPEGGEAVTARLAEIARAMAPHTTGRKPFTYLNRGEKAASAFDADTLARLREIKRRRDPAGVFRSNQPVLA